MTRIFKKILIFIFILTSYGCGSRVFVAMDDNFRGPQEIYAWEPASRKKLVLRREKQKVLDEVASIIEKRYVDNEDLINRVQIVQALANNTDAKLMTIVSQGESSIVDILDNFKRIKTEMASIKKTGLGLGYDFKKYDKYLELQKPFDPKEYTNTILLFKKGHYEDSIRSFKKMLKKKLPYFLLDNIHFGIGTSYYKLKKFDKAEKTFNRIVSKFPNGDKWPTAHIMIGLIYNETSRKSKAIYELQRALVKNMKPEDRKLVERLLVIIQNDGFAGS